MLDTTIRSIQGVLPGWRVRYLSCERAYRAESPDFQRDGVAIEAPSADLLLTRVHALVRAVHPVHGSRT